MMRAFLDERQRAHDPKRRLAKGRWEASPERPDRIDALREGARAAGCRIETPSDRGMAPIAAVHSAEYLEFLESAHSRWRKLAGASDDVVPNTSPPRSACSYPRSIIGQAGFHLADMACPIGPQSWKSIYWSAQCAVAAAAAIEEGEDRAYALCRPPGHHASADQASGFCYLNNAAICAERLRMSGARPAILDVDVHHGDGAQAIFYRRADMLTLSVHGDPSDFYPFFAGHAQERGEGPGEGANLNAPLPLGAGDDAWLAAIDQLIARMEAHGADALVLALGLDAHENDPFQALRVTSDGFARCADKVASVGLPVAIIQEGGYPSADLGRNLERFLSAL